MSSLSRKAHIVQAKSVPSPPPFEGSGFAAPTGAAERDSRFSGASPALAQFDFLALDSGLAIPNP